MCDTHTVMCDTHIVMSYESTTTRFMSIKPLNNSYTGNSDWRAILTARTRMQFYAWRDSSIHEQPRHIDNVM